MEEILHPYFFVDLLFNRAAKGNQRNPYEEKAYRGPDHREVQARWLLLGSMPILSDFLPRVPPLWPCRCCRRWAFWLSRPIGRAVRGPIAPGQNESIWRGRCNDFKKFPKMPFIFVWRAYYLINFGNFLCVCVCFCCFCVLVIESASEIFNKETSRCEFIKGEILIIRIINKELHPKKSNDNGKTTIWRCISYSKWW